jgi:hypothetical protein
MARNLVRVRLESHRLAVTIPTTINVVLNVTLDSRRDRRLFNATCILPPRNGSNPFRRANISAPPEHFSNLYYRSVERLPVPSALRPNRSPTAEQAPQRNFALHFIRTR